MKFFKRILCLVLSLLFIVQMMTGCAYSSKGENLTRGEFYALFIQNTNMYNDDYSEQNLDDYDAAEYLLYNRYLLDDSQINKCNDLVTKEIVAQVCVRYMEFRETCTVEIKDINKCYDQQAIIDSVGMGIFTLENGYFDAKENMTVIDCQNAIDKMQNIELNSHYEEGELEVEFKDDVVILDESIEITNFGVIEGTSAITPTSSSNSEVKITTLDYKKTTTDPQIMRLAHETNEEIWLDIPKHGYNTLKPKPAVGKVMIKPYFSNNFGQFGNVSNQHFDLYSPTAIMVTKIDENPMGDPFNVRIYGRLATAEEFLADSENEKKINKENCSSGATIKEVPDGSVPEGVEIDVKSKPGTLIVTFGHTFTITDKIYGKQTWRNPTAKPSVNITAEIGDFKLDTKNIGKLILEKSADARVELSYRTYFNTRLEAGGLRYSPANNGNGGLKYSPDKGFSGNLFANVGNARFTGASAGGSKEIKLAQVVIPLGSGFSINTNLYMVVQMDGTISFTVKGVNTATLTVNKLRSGGYDPDFNLKSEKEKEKEVNANLKLEFQLTPNISFLGLNLIDAVGKLGGTIDSMANLYSTSEKKSSSKFYATQDELSKECNGDIEYCIGSSFTVYLGYDFITTKSVIGKFVIDDLELKTPSDKFTILSLCCHYEDGDYTKDGKCTRKDSDVNVNDDKEICLSTYKVVLDKQGQTSVAIDSFPISPKKIDSYGGVTIKSKNKKVATAEYNEACNTILITGIKEGSTEITIIVPQNKKGKKFYEQEISVTVSEAEVVVNPSFEKQTVTVVPLFEECCNNKFYRI